MSVSTQYIVRAVIDSIESEVLPHLEPQARPASHLRACLMMLANVEARIRHEARNLFDDNRELRALLGDAESLGLTRDIRLLLDSYPEQHYFDVAKAVEENRRYQEELTQLIRQLGDTRQTASDAHAGFKANLHRYLEAHDKRDRQLVETALSYVPL